MKERKESTKRIRLLIVNTVRAREPEKIPGVILEEAQAFSDFVDEVRIIIFSNRPKCTRVRKGNVYVHCVPVMPRADALFSLALSTLISQLILIPLIAWLVTRHRINVVRADDVFLTGLPTVMACKLTGASSTIFVAGSLEESLRWKCKLLKYNGTITDLLLKAIQIVERVVMISSDHVFAVTSGLIKRARNYGAKNVSWSGTYLDTCMFKPSGANTDHTRTGILYVGRLETEKGVELVVRAATMFKDENVEITIVGDGPLRQRVNRFVERFGLVEKVKLIGAIPHKEMPLLFNSSDIFVLPSFTEGIPVAMLEAMACSKPVVVTPVGIVPYIVSNKEHALIIPKGDPKVLASAIKKLMADPEMMKKLGENSRKLVLNKFDDYVNMHLEIYGNLVHN